MPIKPDKTEKKLLADIKKTGWHVINVPADEAGPSFSYSIGLYETFGHPEIIIVGLKGEVAHGLINRIGEAVREGKKFSSGKFYSGIIDSFKCFLLTVAEKNYEEYVGYARWHYQGNQFPLLQCLFPTVTGKFPWQWPSDKKHLQPILGKRSTPKAKAKKVVPKRK
jgi:Domain of unknown function (DUF4262)